VSLSREHAVPMHGEPGPARHPLRSLQHRLRCMAGPRDRRDTQTLRDHAAPSVRWQGLCARRLPSPRGLAFRSGSSFSSPVLVTTNTRCRNFCGAGAAGRGRAGAGRVGGCGGTAPQQQQPAACLHAPHCAGRRAPEARARRTGHARPRLRRPMLRPPSPVAPLPCPALRTTCPAPSAASTSCRSASAAASLAPPPAASSHERTLASEHTCSAVGWATGERRKAYRQRTWASQHAYAAIGGAALGAAAQTAARRSRRSGLTGSVRVRARVREWAHGRMGAGVRGS
jgi:hypothetical protein